MNPMVIFLRIRDIKKLRKVHAPYVVFCIRNELNIALALDNSHNLPGFFETLIYNFKPSEMLNTRCLLRSFSLASLDPILDRP